MLVTRGLLLTEVNLCGDIYANVFINVRDTASLTCQAFFKYGATLTIEAGSTITAITGATPAAALIIERGAKIIARGRPDAPITFTASGAPPLAEAGQKRASELRGLWGGLIILGNAPTSASTPKQVEGISGYEYGGSNPFDDSGVLQYVRVWYGGAVIGANNEINGITFAGVGNGTTVDHIEVAFNVDDGVEFFGGTVNVKYLSVLFCGDDAIDTDEGYQGKIQFAFVMLASDSDHGTEMDSRTNSDLNSQPRSYPQLYNALFVTSRNHNPASVSSDDLRQGVMRLREGTGGEFANIIITNMGPGSTAVLQTDCGAEERSDSVDLLSSASYPNRLWFSRNNIIDVSASGTIPYEFDASCGGADLASTFNNVNEAARNVLIPSNTDENTKFIDPRPHQDSPAWYNVDHVPNDGFFDPVDFKGAFGEDLWLSGWSWLDDQGRLPQNLWGLFIVSTDDTGIVQLGSQTWFPDQPVMLCSQAIVRTGATLRILPGTMIYAFRDNGYNKAPVLVVNKGGRIEASGKQDMPITFTSALPDRHLARGVWGGLIVLGDAPTSASTPREVEGIRGYTYGGDNPYDSSGTIQYVRVFYGGEVIGANNEINGITFAGVGNGTTVDHIEVAFNLDDGVEFFGGTVNVKYMSVLFVGDDGIDTDEGYQGKIQFAFVMSGRNAQHGTEMDSRTNSDLNSQPRSFPQLYNALFIHQAGIPTNLLEEPVSSDDSLPGVLRLREGTGGQFGNILMTNVGSVGIVNNDCGDEERVQSLPASKAFPDYLYVSPNNGIFRHTRMFDSACDPAGLTLMRTNDPQLRDVPYMQNSFGADEETSFIDPRPISTASNAYKNVDTVPNDGFFTQVNYRGAFSADYVWLEGWSLLSDQGKLPYVGESTRIAALEAMIQQIAASSPTSPFVPNLPTNSTYTDEDIAALSLQLQQLQTAVTNLLTTTSPTPPLIPDLPTNSTYTNEDIAALFLQLQQLQTAVTNLLTTTSPTPPLVPDLPTNFTYTNEDVAALFLQLQQLQTAIMNLQSTPSSSVPSTTTLALPNPPVSSNPTYSNYSAMIAQLQVQIDELFFLLRSRNAPTGAGFDQNSAICALAVLFVSFLGIA